MTHFSPLGSIPAGEDTDPLANVYQSDRGIADFIDQLIVFASDDTVNNDAVLHTSTELVFQAEAGKFYAFEFHLLFRCASSAVDVKIAVGRSVGSGDLTWSLVGLDPAAGAGSVGDAAMGGVFQGGSSDFVEAGVSAGVTGVHVYGTYYAAADATISLRWSQKTATATDMTLSEGSYMKAQVINA